MRMISKPRSRPGHREKRLCIDTERNFPARYKMGASGVHMQVSGEDSRSYELTLTTDEIITCPLLLPPNSIANAVANPDVKIECLPDVLGQLIKGVMQRQEKAQ